MTPKISLPIALVVLVVVLWFVLARPSQATPAASDPYAYDRAIRATALQGAPGGGGSGPLTGACQTAFAYNDPSRYVGHQDQRVAAVSTTGKVLSTINCGAVNAIEKGASWVGSKLGGLF